jgi:NAD(P) transhydrogenase subunit alpha
VKFLDYILDRKDLQYEMLGWEKVRMQTGIVREMLRCAQHDHAGVGEGEDADRHWNRERSSSTVKIVVISETHQGERRVALMPDIAAKLAASGFEVVVEAGAGEQAGFTDDAFGKAGVVVEADRQILLSTADVVLSVQPPRLEDVALMRAEAASISFLQPASQGAVVEALAARGVTAFSLVLLPRTSRAQSMDALSSQSSLAGYKAVLMAANRLGKFFPMLITAAGTIPPAHVLVLGAGVAGLQAIATARRLGAVVESYDVRPAVKDEVKSLGARFLELGLETQEGEGGYAQEQSEMFLTRQRELLAEHVAANDVVITTASIPGRKAPLLITASMVKGMRRGSVIVDMAAESGGNCEVTQPGQVIEVDGVWVDGTSNIPSTVALHASQLYARNITNLLNYLVVDGRLKLDFEDEITRSCCVTHAGKVVIDILPIAKARGFPLSQVRFPVSTRLA